jgi:hypothetical protein
MLRLRICITALIFFGVLSCGKNNGTPTPQQNESVTDGLMLAPRDGALLQPSDLLRWRSEVRWAESPRFSDEQILAMTGVVFIRAVDGSVPLNVTNVELIADMPQHGHGTGNNLPVVRPTAGDMGRLTFDNLIFTMQGQWRIRILATVDGRKDVWTTWVDVR